MGTDAWQPIINAQVRQEQRDEELTALYMRQLANLFQSFVAPYPVRTMVGQLKYYMLHVAPHPRGLRAMNDVTYRVAHEYAGEREHSEAARGKQLAFADLLEPTPTPEESEQQTITRLAEDIYALGKQRGLITFGRIQDEFAVALFGRVLERHFRAACRSLIGQGKASIGAESKIVDKTLLSFK